MRHTQNTAKIAQASEAEYAYPIPYYAGLLLPMALAISYIYIYSSGLLMIPPDMLIPCGSLVQSGNMGRLHIRLHSIT